MSTFFIKSKRGPGPEDLIWSCLALESFTTNNGLCFYYKLLSVGRFSMRGSLPWVRMRKVTMMISVSKLTISTLCLLCVFIECIGETLLTKIRCFGCTVLNTSSVYFTECSPPQVKSPSITFIPPDPLPPPPLPSLCSSPHCCLCPSGFSFCG